MMLKLTTIAFQVLFAGSAVLAQPVAGSNQGTTQDEKARPGRRAQAAPTEMRIFGLKHASAEDVAGVVGRLLRGAKFVADPNTNSLIVNGTSEDLQKAKELIAALDVPVDAPKTSTSEVVLIQLHHRSADEVAGHISRVASTRSARIAADSARETVILNGPPAFIRTAQLIAARLDTPAESVQLEFTFFRADLNSTGVSKNIPKDLADVAKELSRFGSIELIGRLAAVASEGEKFSISGAISNDMRAMVQGRLLKAVAGGGVRLAVDADMTLQRESQTETQKRREQSSFKVETTLLTRRGDTVVIGSAPTGWAPGESAILVVQVRS